jgi:hypothetical protein
METLVNKIKIKENPAPKILQPAKAMVRFAQ